MGRKIAGLVVLALLAGGANAAERPGADVYARLRDFEARLDSQDSATAALQGWCADHLGVDPPIVRAIRDRDVVKPADGEVRRRLKAEPDEPIVYRRVRLACGGRVLSEADNWYRPGLLTPTMNTTLETTDTPFGAVVRPLGFHRRGLEARTLLRPGAHETPREVLRRRAVLVTADGRPFSLVVETYLAETLAAPGPAAVSP